MRHDRLFAALIYGAAAAIVLVVVLLVVLGYANLGVPS